MGLDFGSKAGARNIDLGVAIHKVMLKAQILGRISESISEEKRDERNGNRNNFGNHQ